VSLDLYKLNRSYSPSLSFVVGSGSSIANFVSGDLVITPLTDLVVPHGLGSEPKWCDAILKNLIADQGWLPGDEINIVTSDIQRITGGAGFGIEMNSTNIIVYFGNVIQLINKTTFATANIVTASWRLVISAQSF